MLGVKPFTVFVDYSKAFNTLNRRTLITKVGHAVTTDYAVTTILRDILAYISKLLTTSSCRKTSHRQTVYSRATPFVHSYSILPPWTQPK
jgi:hypothetical protein